MGEGDALPGEASILDRMEKLVRRVADRWTYDADGTDFSVAAGRLVSELDRIRDPDIALAERIAASHCGANVSAVLNGIKMGRELAATPNPAPEEKEGPAA